MKARIFWLGCAQSLLPLFLAGCCCDPAPRANCPHGGGCGNGGHVAKHGDCGHAGACGRDGRYLSHRPLLKFEHPCPYGFPPYVPAPLGYMTGDLRYASVSTPRHVEFDSALVRQAPAQLPSAADQNAKTLPRDEPTAVVPSVPKHGNSAPTVKPTPAPVNVEPKTTHTNPQTKQPETKQPEKAADVKDPSSATIAQPRIAPRSTEPEAAKVDQNLEVAPSPDDVQQPVSVPAPTKDETQGDELPENPLNTDSGADAVTEPVVKAPADTQPVVPDAPSPANETGSGETGENSEEWPDAPLPENDLPPLPDPAS